MNFLFWNKNFPKSIWTLKLRFHRSRAFTLYEYMWEMFSQSYSAHRNTWTVGPHQIATPTP